MKTMNTMISAALALAVAGILAAAVSFGQSAPPPSPAAAAATSSGSVVVINIVKLFNQLDEERDGEQQLEKLTQDLTNKKNAKQKEVDDLSTQLQNNIFKPGSAEFLKMQDDLLMKSMDLQTFVNYAQQKTALEQRLKTAELYRKINDAIEQYSKAHGIALVFVVDDPNFSSARTTEQLTMAISTRKIMYSDPAYDITRKIIEKMNADHALGSGK